MKAVIDILLQNGLILDLIQSLIYSLQLIYLTSPGTIFQRHVEENVSIFSLPYSIFFFSLPSLWFVPAHIKY